jgi:sugar (pentulose or hexulose) kinase
VDGVADAIAGVVAVDVIAGADEIGTISNTGTSLRVRAVKAIPSQKITKNKFLTKEISSPIVQQ